MQSFVFYSYLKKLNYSQNRDFYYISRYSAAPCFDFVHSFRSIFLIIIKWNLPLLIHPWKFDLPIFENKTTLSCLPKIEVLHLGSNYECLKRLFALF